MDLDANQEPIRAAVDAGQLAGAVTLVWLKGEIAQIAATGLRDVERALPMEHDTLFRLASMTKPIATAAAMRLVDAGVLGLDDAITTWAPEFERVKVLASPAGPLEATEPLARPITVRDLLTHQAGIGYPFTIAGPISRAYSQLPRGNPDAWLAALAALPLVHQPGAAMTYGHSTDLLGVLLARASGATTDDVLREHVLDPTRMSQTGFCVPESRQNRVASAYQSGADGGLEAAPLRPPKTGPQAFCRAGEGLVGTAQDYLRFARMLLRGGNADGTQVVSAQSTALMRSDHMNPALRARPFLGAPWAGQTFGLGLNLVTDPAQHRAAHAPAGLGSFGWPGAYGTWWQADPEHDLILIYLTQHIGATSGAVAADNASIRLVRRAQQEFTRRTYQALGFADAQSA
ncbi:beta-lactamase [Segniliparus rotundus DSM 44985]|uniref:Beta-lactamase n=1 Tax=Segniliparus rotundus (strain ATCC BAA-972 / CDC 1076 / CIP 108378 / DSM 44985 / JCM 13578) TaxID=640132 RepID=D6Z7H0_SEGRD|nr:serine hydrolase domain-containing protein [Segniliparus rotundus]ADG97900.1 beta-lactamase [Segniliparus rotundus DSM 44985]